MMSVLSKGGKIQTNTHKNQNCGIVEKHIFMAKSEIEITDKNVQFENFCQMAKVLYRTVHQDFAQVLL